MLFVVNCLILLVVLVNYVTKVVEIGEILVLS